MKSKLLLIVGLVVGYVLGARAGRDRYDALAAKANGLWRDPRVSRARSDAARYAREQAPVIKARAETGARSAAAAAKDAADRTTRRARDVTDKTVATTRGITDKATTAARGAADRTVNAAAGAAAKVGEARERALADLDELGDLGEETDR